MIRRRELITLLGGAAAAWPVAARGQQRERMRRIGVLISITDGPEMRSRLAAFRQALQEMHWIEGRNLQTDLRFTDADDGRAQIYATELVGLNPDVLIAHTPQALRALLQVTHSIPIVFLQVPDPVEFGVVASMARPDANITGFTHFEAAMGGKWLSLLKEIAPRINRALDIQSQVGLRGSGYLDAIKSAAPSLGMQLSAAEVHSAADVQVAIDAFAREPHGGLIVPADAGTAVHRELILALAARHRLPAVYAYRFFAADGGLMSYGAEALDLFRRSASYVDRILKGEKPSDLPVQAPTKYELVINAKTAKALGLTVPNTLLAVADEVIE